MNGDRRPRTGNCGRRWTARSGPSSRHRLRWRRSSGAARASDCGARGPPWSRWAWPGSSPDHPGAGSQPLAALPAAPAITAVAPMVCSPAAPRTGMRGSSRCRTSPTRATVPARDHPQRHRRRPGGPRGGNAAVVTLGPAAPGIGFAFVQLPADVKRDHRQRRRERARPSSSTVCGIPLPRRRLRLLAGQAVRVTVAIPPPAGRRPLPCQFSIQPPGQGHTRRANGPVDQHLLCPRARRRQAAWPRAHLPAAANGPSSSVRPRR